MVVSLPLFKLAALFVRHISKYGANHIKHQAHEHPRFRAFAAKYGQMMHQLNMRMSVLALRNTDAEQRAKEAKEKAEAPTVKTEEQVRKEEELKAKYGVATPAVKSHPVKEPPKSIWRRKFRPLPEPKAVDLFADVIGDVFILTIASSLLLYEYYRSSSKPDANLVRIKDLERQLEEGRKREEEFLRMDEERKARLQAIEDALRAYRDPRTKRPIFPKPEDGEEHVEEQAEEGFALTRTFSGLAGKLGF